MLRNLLITFESMNNTEEKETFSLRLSKSVDIEEIENDYKSSNYKIISQKELTEKELDNYIINETEEYNTRVLNIHKIGSFQILECKELEETEIYFKPFINYNPVTYIYSDLDSAIVGCLTNKYLESNEANYAQQFINKMLNR